MKKLSETQMKALRLLGEGPLAAEGRGIRPNTLTSLVTMGLARVAGQMFIGKHYIDIWDLTATGKQYLADGRDESLLLTESQWGVLMGVSNKDETRPPLVLVDVLCRKGLVYFSDSRRSWELTALGEKLVEQATL